LRAVLEGEYQPDVFPAQIVKPASGQLTWIVDREAAALLHK
jgi:6-phosphogluconolactonase